MPNGLATQRHLASLSKLTVGSGGVPVQDLLHKEVRCLSRQFNIQHIKQWTMKTNLLTLAVPAAIAASFLIGCSSSLKINDRADAARPSDVQVKEGYDTFGRK